MVEVDYRLMDIEGTYLDFQRGAEYYIYKYQLKFGQNYRLPMKKDEFKFTTIRNR